MALDCRKPSSSCLPPREPEITHKFTFLSKRCSTSDPGVMWVAIFLGEKGDGQTDVDRSIRCSSCRLDSEKHHIINKNKVMKKM
jgi:hypothetical protein